jgi:hypothetical protein
MDRPHRAASLDAEGIIDAIARDELGTLELPHVVAVQDPYLDRATIYGPFPDPVAAAAFALRLADDLAYEGCERHIATSVHPLRLE